MPYPKNTSQLAKGWVEETLRLKPGESLFIPCDNKSAQSALKTRLYGARKEYSIVDPLAAESISFSLVYRDGEPYIRGYKSAREANKGFIKDADGNVKEVTINIEKDRTRKILLLIKEGHNEESTTEVLGKLSDIEKQLFKKGE